MYDCRSLPPYSGQCCWHSERAPFVVYTSVEQNTQVILCKYVCKTLLTVAYLYIVYKYQWQNQYALPLVPGWILVPSDPLRWQEKLLCSVVWHYHQSYVQHYTAILMLVHCLLEVLIGVDSGHGTGSQKERQCQLKVNIMPNIKKVMLIKAAPLRSHLADYVL